MDVVAIFKDHKRIYRTRTGDFNLPVVVVNYFCHHYPEIDLDDYLTVLIDEDEATFFVAGECELFLFPNNI